MIADLYTAAQKASLIDAPPYHLDVFTTLTHTQTLIHYYLVCFIANKLDLYDYF